MNDERGTTSTLPEQMAPALVAAVEKLLQQVPLTTHPDLVIDLTYRGPRCVVCHEGGKLGGHHGTDGRVEWIHEGCHRRLHRRDRLSAADWARIHHRARTAC